MTFEAMRHNIRHRVRHNTMSNFLNEFRMHFHRIRVYDSSTTSSLSLYWSVHFGSCYVISGHGADYQVRRAFFQRSEWWFHIRCHWLEAIVETVRRDVARYSGNYKVIYAYVGFIRLRYSYVNRPFCWVCCDKVSIHLSENNSCKFNQTIACVRKKIAFMFMTRLLQRILIKLHRWSLRMDK